MSGELATKPRKAFCRGSSFGLQGLAWLGLRGPIALDCLAVLRMDLVAGG